MTKSAKDKPMKHIKNTYSCSDICVALTTRKYREYVDNL